MLRLLFDPPPNKMLFLYKLEVALCPSSFGQALRLSETHCLGFEACVGFDAVSVSELSLVNETPLVVG